jgi:hypothetical protein
MIATKIAPLNEIVTGWIKRSMLSTTMKRAKPARSTAPVNPPSAFTLPVPKLNRELDAFEFGNPVGANHTGEL